METPTQSRPDGCRGCKSCRLATERGEPTRCGTTPRVCPLTIKKPSQRAATTASTSNGGIGRG